MLCLGISTILQADAAAIVRRARSQAVSLHDATLMRQASRKGVSSHLPPCKPSG